VSVAGLWIEHVKAQFVLRDEGLLKWAYRAGQGEEERPANVTGDNAMREENPMTWLAERPAKWGHLLRKRRFVFSHLAECQMKNLGPKSMGQGSSHDKAWRTSCFEKGRPW
jgi:hypothetical protein